jgi:hypothetical protein
MANPFFGWIIVKVQGTDAIVSGIWDLGCGVV